MSTFSQLLGDLFYPNTRSRAGRPNNDENRNAPARNQRKTKRSAAQRDGVNGCAVNQPVSKRPALADLTHRRENEKPESGLTCTNETGEMLSEDRPLHTSTIAGMGQGRRSTRRQRITRKAEPKPKQRQRSPVLGGEVEGTREGSVVPAGYGEELVSDDRAGASGLAAVTVPLPVPTPSGDVEMGDTLAGSSMEDASSCSLRGDVAHSMEAYAARDQAGRLSAPPAGDAPEEGATGAGVGDVAMAVVPSASGAASAAGQGGSGWAEDPPQHRNIDECYADSENHCAEYAPDIYQYLRYKENYYMPVSLDYMREVQTELRDNMREILVDWLVEVGEEYRLRSETLFLTKNYIDRYLALEPMERGRLQLLGITAMVVASKFEELSPQSIDEFVYISDNTYDREEVIEFESKLLNVLNFEISSVTEKNFLRRFLMAAAADITNERHLHFTVLLSNFLIERTMQDYAFVKYVPSVIASSAICLALHTIGLRPWTPTLEYYTGYQFEDEYFRRCLIDLYNLHHYTHQSQQQENGLLQAVNEKYNTQVYYFVSQITPAVQLPFAPSPNMTS